MEYFLLFIEYHVLRWKKMLTNIIIPIITGSTVYCFYTKGISFDVTDYYGNTINILGILIGFSISIFAILLSLENDNIRKAKEENLKIKMYSKNVSLYDALLVDFAYIIIVQGFLLMANILLSIISFGEKNNMIIVSIDISMTIYIIVLLLRCMLDMYFILTKKE